jgi:hypothetical protein
MIDHVHQLLDIQDNNPFCLIYPFSTPGDPLEGDLEEDLGEVAGNLQGRSIDVITTEEMKSWRAAVEQAGVHQKKG